MDIFMEPVTQVWNEKTVPKSWGDGKIEALWEGDTPPFDCHLKLKSTTLIDILQNLYHQYRKTICTNNFWVSTRWT